MVIEDIYTIKQLSNSRRVAAVVSCSCFVIVAAYKSASGQRTFLYRAMSFWNSLPLEIRECDNLSIFKRHLKEFLSSF